MSSFDRRRFLGMSLSGLGAAAWGAEASRLRAADLPAAEPKKIDPGAPFDTLFLTWRQDPTTTVVVQWIGPAAGPTRIDYAPRDGELWRSVPAVGRPFPGTELQVYRGEITGLFPGTEYKFQAGGASPDYWFRTMPARATDVFSFISGGDAGTGKAAVTSNLLAARQDPYFALIGGDVAYDNGKSPGTFLTFLRNYHATMRDSQGRLIPLVTCLGNHEVDGGYNGKREAAGSYLSVFDVFFTETSYGVLDFGDYLSLVLLDSGHLAPIPGAQTDWLQQTLAAREDHLHVFAVQHVPCYPSQRTGVSLTGKPGTGAEQRKLWSPLFERHKVNVVLEHHDHTFKRSHPLTDGLIDERAGVLYLGDGSWGKLRPPKPPAERPYLAKVSQSYHVTLHRLEGERRFHVALDDSGKIADVATTVSQRAAR